jgi:hypothetical protein
MEPWQCSEASKLRPTLCALRGQWYRLSENLCTAPHSSSSSHLHGGGFVHRVAASPCARLASQRPTTPGWCKSNRTGRALLGHQWKPSQVPRHWRRPGSDWHLPAPCEMIFYFWKHHMKCMLRADSDIARRKKKEQSDSETPWFNNRCTGETAILRRHVHLVRVAFQVGLYIRYKMHY